MKPNNQGFVCLSCQRPVSVADKTSRNHCPYCFLSLHVDKDIPGDRASECQGVMVPVDYLIANGEIKIRFVCVRCFHTHRNKVANDDEIGLLDKSISSWKKKYPRVCELYTD